MTRLSVLPDVSSAHVFAYRHSATSCGSGRIGSGGRAVATLLEDAFAKAATLPTAERDVLTSRLLAELDRLVAQLPLHE